MSAKGKSAVARNGYWHYTMKNGHVHSICGEFESEASWAADRTLKILQRGIAPAAKKSFFRFDTRHYIDMRAEDGHDMGRIEAWAHANDLLPELARARKPAYELEEYIERLKLGESDKRRLQEELRADMDALIRKQAWQFIETDPIGNKGILVTETTDPQEAFKLIYRLKSQHPPLMDAGEYFTMNNEIKDALRLNIKDNRYRIAIREDFIQDFHKKYEAEGPPPPSHTDRSARQGTWVQGRLF